MICIAAFDEMGRHHLNYRSAFSLLVIEYCKAISLLVIAKLFTTFGSSLIATATTASATATTASATATAAAATAATAAAAAATAAATATMMFATATATATARMTSVTVMTATTSLLLCHKYHSVLADRRKSTSSSFVEREGDLCYASLRRLLSEWFGFGLEYQVPRILDYKITLVFPNILY